MYFLMKYRSSLIFASSNSKYVLELKTVTKETKGDTWPGKKKEDKVWLYICIISIRLLNSHVSSPDFIMPGSMHYVYHVRSKRMMLPHPLVLNPYMQRRNMKTHLILINQAKQTKLESQKFPNAPRTKQNQMKTKNQLNQRSPNKAKPNEKRTNLFT